VLKIARWVAAHGVAKAGPAKLPADLAHELRSHRAALVSPWPLTEKVATYPKLSDPPASAADSAS
jgi:hypothetical protein